jgi:ABC-type antimicrobial peptide transport system permease subunit
VSFVRADQPRPRRGQEPSSFVRSVTNGYFQLLNIPIVKGRALGQNDIASGPRVAVINQNLATHLYAGEDPIGKQLLLLAGDEPSIPEGVVEIVGIAANVREVGLNEVPFDAIYVPASQVVPRTMYVVVRTPASASAGPVLKQEMQALDPGQFIAELKPLQSYVNDQMRGSLFNFAVVAIFAGLCLLLTVVALFGTLSFSVVQQRRDIGVRIAVGARSLDVLKLISRQTCYLVALGSTIGLTIALVAGKLAGDRLFMVPHRHEGILYGVSMRDPLSLSFAASILLLVASAAALLPALRATRVEPNIALRGE